MTMAKIVPLQYFDEFSNSELQSLIADAGRAASLRDAVKCTIRAIHGLPDILGVELQKIEVYVGRAGATAPHVRNRWWARLEEFAYAPSSHAMVVASTRTDRFREQRWERAAQLIVNRLVDNRALCCANALLGESGKWPSTEDSLVYIVAKARKGPTPPPASQNQVNAAVASLVMDASSEAFSHEVFITAGQGIQQRDDRDDHEVIYPEYWDDGDEEDEEWESSCRREGCDAPAKAGNYGFCGRHRPHVVEGQTPCKVCGRPARDGNYGFCGRHRR
jgi:hypothetical protein